MKLGDRVCIKTKDDSLEGVLMPEQGKTVFLKLDTGYNLGILKHNIESIKLLKAHKEPKVANAAVKHNASLPNIAIVHTGGTIASKVDYETGAVIARFSPEELLARFPVLRNIANITSELLSNMWSEDIRFVHYNVMAHAVEKAIKNSACGVIITHGTDTLHYSSAALSFALENVPVPVVLVGAQRSSDRPSSDAGLNLIGAARFIVDAKVPGVFIAMHEDPNDAAVKIIHGCHARKMHTSRRDAFETINRQLICRVLKSGSIEWIERPALDDQQTNKFTVREFKKHLKVGLIKVHPNMYVTNFSAYKGYDGLLIEGTGMAGNIPINKIDAHTSEHSRITRMISALIKNGTIVAAASQAIHGRINMNVYSTGRKMQEGGILGNYTTMTPETAFIKLAWLLSNYKTEDVKKLYAQNVRGEILDRELYSP